MSVAPQPRPPSETEFIVPGVYLTRSPDHDIRDELRYAGLLFSRRFLAHTPRSDHLVLFDPNILKIHAKVEEPETGSWAALVKAKPSDPETPPVPEVVEAKKPKPRVVPLGKKARPGRHAREMLKALKEASADIVPEEIKTPVPEEKKEIPPGATLLVRGNGPLHPLFRLRPFHVSTTMDIDELRVTPGLITVPHLIVYNPPRPQDVKERDPKALLHVEKSQGYVKYLLGLMVTCGILPDDSACRVMNAQMDASRLSRSNLVAMQCRFRDDVPMSVRNAVYAILRSSPWFEEDHYLVRCWWKQVSATADDS